MLPYVPDPETDLRETERYLDEIAAALRAEGAMTQTEVIFQGADSVAREILDVAERTIVDVIAMAHASVGAASRTWPWAASRPRSWSTARSRRC